MDATWARPLITPRSAVRIAGMVALAPAPDLADVVEQHWVVAWDHARGRRWSRTCFRTRA
jgi:hypothetical protein